MNNTTNQPVSLTRYAWLSIFAAIVTITLKSAAYVLTGSVGLLSDAIESFVNLAAAIVALIALSVLARPANDEFTFGFSCVSFCIHSVYFSELNSNRYFYPISSIANQVD